MAQDKINFQGQGKTMRKLNSILVTGGSGFIGSNFIRYVLARSDFNGKIVNLDKLTYAGNPINLADIAERYPDRYVFYQADICDRESLQRIFTKKEIDTVVHFAAESHVDRSILGPAQFIQTNIIGTFNLLEAALELHKSGRPIHFHHVSTDEVFGSLGETGYFTETTPYDPRSPYSASKAASDHLVRAWHHTYGLSITLSNCSNNYGPYHFPEKLIPLTLTRLLHRQSVPIYGDGQNVRDWLYVEDHAEAIWLILNQGKTGESYNIGGHNEETNLDLVRKLCRIVAKQTDSNTADLEALITFVPDRPGHDRRYAIDPKKIQNELGWMPRHSLEEGLWLTVEWYLKNQHWVQSVLTGEYRTWIERQYEKRGKDLDAHQRHFETIKRKG